MVQQELHPEDEGREGNGDPGQPLANEAAAGVPEALTPRDIPEEPAAHEVMSSTPPEPVEGLSASEIEGSIPGPVDGPGPSGFEEAVPGGFEEPVPSGFEEPVRNPVEGPVLSEAEGTLAAAGDPAAGPEMRLEIDNRTNVIMQRLNVWKDELVAWFKTLASAAVYATLIVTFGFQVARVEGQSMAPTLSDQDRLIVNKLAYRLGEPRRGDIVMLYYPINPDKSFVKRVIAEEGDQVRIVEGRVYVNDVPMRDDFVPPEYRSHDDWGPKVVDEGYYFVMGDHRNNSSDSRHWGFVPKKYIIGKVQLRWWPIPSAHVF